MDIMICILVNKFILIVVFSFIEECVLIVMFMVLIGDVIQILCLWNEVSVKYDDDFCLEVLIENIVGKIVVGKSDGKCQMDL